MAAARGPAAKASDLAQARRQIAELERKVGQQQLDLDFFKQALRRIEASRRPNDGPGATASSLRSKRENRGQSPIFPIDVAGTITKAGLRPYGESADTTDSFRRPFSLDRMYLLCSLGRALFDIVNQHVATTGCGGPEPLPRAPVFVLIFLAGGRPPGD